MNILSDKKYYIWDHWKQRCKEFPWLENNTIFLSIHGSTSYGLNTPESDVDMCGVVVPPKEFFLGFQHHLDQIQFNKPDGCIYNIIKFCKLAAENNPNVMELLWIPEKYWVSYTSDWLKLVRNRHLFLSSKIKHTYLGYSHAQFKRIKLHKQHLLNPPTHQPTREEFGLPETRIISRDQQGALNALEEHGYVLMKDSNFMEYLRKENEYQRAKQIWDQYQTWKTNRNPKRAELEAKYGYDVKHCSQLVRLIRQCKELLTTGELLVERPDREEILAIKNGAWTYEYLLQWADDQEREIEELATNTTLSHEPNRKAIDALCIEIVEQYIY
jgi:predicted nucleotidyltransferase